MISFAGFRSASASVLATLAPRSVRSFRQRERANRRARCDAPAQKNSSICLCCYRELFMLNFCFSLSDGSHQTTSSEVQWEQTRASKETITVQETDRRQGTQVGQQEGTPISPGDG